MTVPLVATSSGPALRPEQLGPLLKVDVRSLTPETYRVTIQDVAMELEPGVPMVRIAGAVRPLANPPLVRDGHLVVPLQFVSEIVPSAVDNLRWDGRTRQLVVFSFVDRSSGREQVGGAPLGRHQVADPPRTAANTPRAQSPRSKRPRPSSSEQHVVVVDAGHGGPDNGMSGPIGASPEDRIYEKNITLAVAMKLGRELADRRNWYRGPAR